MTLPLRIRHNRTDYEVYPAYTMPDLIPRDFAGSGDSMTFWNR